MFELEELDPSMLELEAFDPNVFELTDADVEMFELEAPVVGVLFCRLGAPARADSDGPSMSESVCDFGVSGTCSESWSSFGDVSSTLVAIETGRVDSFEFSETGCSATGIDRAGPSSVESDMVVLVGAAPLVVTGAAGAVD